MQVLSILLLDSAAPHWRLLFSKTMNKWFMYFSLPPNPRRIWSLVDLEKSASSLYVVVASPGSSRKFHESGRVFSLQDESGWVGSP